MGSGNFCLPSRLGELVLPMALHSCRPFGSKYLKRYSMQKSASGSLVQWSAPGGAGSFAGSDELAEGVPEQSHQGAMSCRVLLAYRLEDVFGCGHLFTGFMGAVFGTTPSPIRGSE